MAKGWLEWDEIKWWEGFTWGQLKKKYGMPDSQVSSRREENWIKLNRIAFNPCHQRAFRFYLLFKNWSPQGVGEAFCSEQKPFHFSILTTVVRTMCLHSNAKEEETCLAPPIKRSAIEQQLENWIDYTTPFCWFTHPMLIREVKRRDGGFFGKSLSQWSLSV